MLQYVTLLVFSIIGAILYRMGGASGYDTKFRDIGIPTLVVLYLSLFVRDSISVVPFILSMLFTFGLVFASQTTYFKKKGEPARWWNWVLVGLANGIALVPFVLVSHSYFSLCVRTLMCVVFITYWSVKVDDAVKEELGRGFIIIATLGVF